MCLLGGKHLQHVVESLVPSTRQPIDTHVLNPLFTRITAGVPACNDALVVIALVPEKLADFEVDIMHACSARNGRSPQGIDLMHTLHELQQPLPFGLCFEHGNDILLKQRNIPGKVCLEVLEQVG